MNLPHTNCYSFYFITAIHFSVSMIIVKQFLCVKEHTCWYLPNVTQHRTTHNDLWAIVCTIMQNASSSQCDVYTMYSQAFLVLPVEDPGLLFLVPEHLWYFPFSLLTDDCGLLSVEFSIVGHLSSVLC